MSIWKLFFSDNSFMSVQLGGGEGGQWILLSSTLKSSARGGGIPQEKNSCQFTGYHIFYFIADILIPCFILMY